MAILSDTARPFVASFQKAIGLEMAAMRQQLGSFEVPLGSGTAVLETEKQTPNRYVFRILAANDKLAAHMECSLRHDAGEYLVQIEDIDGEKLTLACESRIALNRSEYVLIIYPWFLYEKLRSALGDLLLSDDRYLDSAFRVFGKRPHQMESRQVFLAHRELNDSQRSAVSLCCRSNLSFIWGPPGTGKTTVLGHIVAELLGQGLSILVTSTTNAAVDQALAKLHALEDTRPYFARGDIIRLGQTGEDTYGASLREVLHRRNAKARSRLDRIKKRTAEIAEAAQACRRVMAIVRQSAGKPQLSLFESPPSAAVRVWDLAPIFGERRSRSIANHDAQRLQELVSIRQHRLETAKRLYSQRIEVLIDKARSKESEIVAGARVVLATMSNVYLSPHFADRRFDVVIIEEAGMAILPAVFYCASLAKKKAVIVGDPKQLPSIVQSRDAYVRKAMGRSIFEVSVPDPYRSEVVVMLNTQYRMHPAIGDLVSRLFYGGRLHNDRSTQRRFQVAEAEPFAGSPLALLDTDGRTSCDIYEGSFSRINAKSAEACAMLAQTALTNGLGSVAIITPYAAQSRLVRSKISEFAHDAPNLECRTVHRFQGNERDLVILDTVDTSPLRPGVLLNDPSPSASSDNLINVSVSRARGKLIVVADVTYFFTHVPKGTISKLLNEVMVRGIRVAWRDFIFDF